MDQLLFLAFKKSLGPQKNFLIVLYVPTDFLRGYKLSFWTSIKSPAYIKDLVFFWSFRISKDFFFRKSPKASGLALDF